MHRSGGFQKRDGGRKDTETLISRLVDRCLRPVFKKGWANEVQILEWVYSYDGVHSTEPLAITAASAALALSGAHRCGLWPTLHAPQKGSVFVHGFRRRLFLSHQDKVKEV